MTGDLTDVGASPHLLVRPGQSFTHTLVVAEEEVFIGTVRLERSTTGQTWDVVAAWTGTALVPLEGAAASGTIRNEDHEAARYRFVCSVFDEASDAIAWTFEPAVDALGPAVTNRDGVPILSYTDEGIVVPKITATVLVAPATLLDFSALPTSDPLIAGRLWLDTATLKVSTGA